MVLRPRELLRLFSTRDICVDAVILNGAERTTEVIVGTRHFVDF